MAYTRRMYPKGSWILKAVIAVLIAVLITSVLYPQSLWKRQENLTEDSRERMDNLNIASNRYFEVNGSYLAQLDSLISFMETDSIEVEPALFEFERLSLYDANYDSFLVGFNDMFHFDHIEMEPYLEGEPLDGYEGNPEMKMRDTVEDPDEVIPDSVVMVMLPNAEFADVVPPVKAYFTSPRGIRYYYRDKGEDDIYWMIWSRGKMERDYLPYPNPLVPSQEYLLYRDLEVIDTDPITDEPFRLYLNKRITLEGEYVYRKTSGEPDSALAESELALNLFINKLARAARSNLEKQMNRDLEAGDSTLYKDQIKFQTEYFKVELEKILNRRRARDIVVDGSRELMVAADSVDNYRNDERIKLELFKVKYDSLIRVWTDMEMTQDLVSEMSYESSFDVTEEKVVGVTIEPPFGSEYELPNRNVLDALFGVGPIENPGYIENNDLSWSEKR